VTDDHQSPDMVVGRADQIEGALGARLVEGLVQRGLEVPATAVVDRLPGLLGAHRGRDQRLVGLDAAVRQPLAGLRRIDDAPVAQLALVVARA